MWQNLFHLPGKLKYQLVILGVGLEDRGSGVRARKFSGPLPFRLAPVKVGDEYDVRIESMSKRGDSGVAKIQGLVVFISGTKVGDSPRIKITKIGSGFATADVISKGAVNPLTEGAETSEGI